MKGYEYTKFIDETGDLNFYKKGGQFAVGNEGISLTFSIGMVHMKQDLHKTRDEIKLLAQKVELNPYLNTIPSVKKRIDNGGFYFHAKDDPAEVRAIFFEYLKNSKFSLEIVVARKIQNVFVKKHNKSDIEFYADVLGHLLKNKMRYSRLVLNIAQRGSSTSPNNLELAKNKALLRFKKMNPGLNGDCKFVYNVQNFNTEPILSIADYSSWAVQRVFEKGEIRYYEYIKEKIPCIVDIYDSSKYFNSKNIYGRKGYFLTSENKIEIGPLVS